MTRISPASRKYAANRRRVKNEMSASSLRAGKAVDARRDVTIVAGIGLQFQEDRQGPRNFARLVETAPEVVEKRTRLVRPWGGRLRRAFQPVDGLRHLTTVAIQAAEERHGVELMRRRLRRRLQRRDRIVQLPHLEERSRQRHVLFREIRVAAGTLAHPLKNTVQG